MNKITTGFFSFTEITDPKEHRAYNEWHMLDHQPEQFPIAGVHWGSRWVLSPACRKLATTTEPPFDKIHYMTLYLMGEPLDATLREFGELAAVLSSMGRFHRHRRSHVSGPYNLLRASAVPRVRISAEALPWRPNMGLFVTVYEPGDDLGRFDEYEAWRDTVHHPDVLSVPGVAGLYQFADKQALQPFKKGEKAKHIQVYFLDRPALEVVQDIGRRREEWKKAGRMPDFGNARKLLFAAPLEAIRVGEWDWFDK